MQLTQQVAEPQRHSPGHLYLQQRLARLQQRRARRRGAESQIFPAAANGPVKGNAQPVILPAEERTAVIADGCSGPQDTVKIPAIGQFPANLAGLRQISPGEKRLCLTAS